MSIVFSVKKSYVPAVWNPNDKSNLITVTSPKVAAYTGSSGNGLVRSVTPVTTGTWYVEYVVSGSVNSMHLGLSNSLHRTNYILGWDGVGGSVGVGLNGALGRLYHDGTYNSIGYYFGDGDIVMIAWDMSNGRMWYGKNGTWRSPGDPENNLNPTYTEGEFVGQEVYLAASMSNVEHAVELQTTPSEFSYTCPTGFTPIGHLEE